MLEMAAAVAQNARRWRRRWACLPSIKGTRWPPASSNNNNAPQGSQPHRPHPPLPQLPQLLVPLLLQLLLPLPAVGHQSKAPMAPAPASASSPRHRHPFLCSFARSSGSSNG